MGEQGRPGAAVDAVVNGVLTGAWYALPDVVATRRARVALKAAVAVAGVAATARARKPADGDTPDDTATGNAPDLTSLVAHMSTEPVIDAQSPGPAGTAPGRTPRRAKAVAVSLIVLTVVGSVAGERAVHRWGERLRARGVRYAHTRIGLVAGGVAGVSSWALAH